MSTDTLTTYRVSQDPRISRNHPVYCICMATAVSDDGEPEDGAEPESLAFMVRRQLSPRIGCGYVFTEVDLIHQDGLPFPVLNPDSIPASTHTPGRAVRTAAKPAVPAPVSTDRSIPADRDEGWADDDGLMATTPVTRSRIQSAPSPGIATAIRERQQMIQEASRHLPHELIESLDYTARAYKLLAGLVGAQGRPTPNDVRSMVISNMIEWHRSRGGNLDLDSHQDQQ